MIAKLLLKNFKPFSQQSLDFRNLTILSGINSSGKSSVIQVLLLLRQSYQQNLLPDVGLALNGDLVSIGMAQDALCEYSSEDVISFEIFLNNGSHGQWLFNYDQAADVMKLLEESKVTNEVYHSSLFHDKFHYIQAERLGPRRYFEISDFQVKQHQQMGIQGEYTAYFLEKYGTSFKVLSGLQHPLDNNLGLLLQVQAWINEISPGTKIHVNSNSAMDLVTLQYNYGLGNKYRSTNVGFGITYTLPILVAILSAKPDTLILLENPEAHLHPKGQAKMGELIALAANCGIQIVVETHSDHLLNGIRVMTHRGKISPDNIQLHYFQRYINSEQCVTEVISPRIDRRGRISEWPDGFFDEWDKSLEILLGPIEE